MANLLVISLLILNLIDAVGTHLAVGVFKYAMEANPVMAWVIGQGWGWFYAIKLALLPAILYPVWTKREQWKPNHYLIGWILVSVYGLVAVTHLVLAWMAYFNRLL